MSHCQCCRLSWDVVDHHTTWYRDNRGCFPLCESCWTALEPATRLPYYLALMGIWQSQGSTDVAEARQAIIDAVKAGL